MEQILFKAQQTLSSLDVAKSTLVHKENDEGGEYHLRIPSVRPLDNDSLSELKRGSTHIADIAFRHKDGNIGELVFQIRTGQAMDRLHQGHKSHGLPVMRVAL